MRVMVIVKASKESEAGEIPREKVLADMGSFNEQLVKAGVMLAGEGLHPTSKGKRVRFSGKELTLEDLHAPLVREGGVTLFGLPLLRTTRLLAVPWSRVVGGASTQETP